MAAAMTFRRAHPFLFRLEMRLVCPQRAAQLISAVPVRFERLNHAFSGLTEFAAAASELLRVQITKLFLRFDILSNPSSCVSFITCLCPQIGNLDRRDCRNP